MAEKLTSRERILRTLRGEPVDRVPIHAPIPWSPMWSVRGEEPEWASDPNYAPVRELCDQHCDALIGIAQAGVNRAFPGIDEQYIERLPEQQNGPRRRRTTIVHTPKGDLRTTDEWEEGIRTSWYPEPLIKDKEDAERFLSIPYEFKPPDLSGMEEAREKAGERGLTQAHVSTPMVCVSRMIHFDQFLEWCAGEFELIDRMVCAVQERTRDVLDYVMGHGGGPMVWFGGSEQATPPMMSPRLYDALVEKYDAPLFDVVHRHGGLVHVHCHGKISGILDRLVEMGVDALDPVEPPPQGDIEMGEAKRRVDGNITLMGNVEFCDLEFAEPDEIERQVQHAICDGGKKYMMLYPSATGITDLTERYRDNAIRYIEAGLKYGTFDA